MSEVSEFVQAAWRDGVGPDDRRRLAELLARAEEPAISGDPAYVELRLFAAWFDLANKVRAELPAPPGDVATAILHTSAELELACLARDSAKIDATMETLSIALEDLSPDHPHAAAARAWADLAVGDIALIVGDTKLARRRYDAVTANGNPVALRVTAMLKLAGIALERLNVEPARKWARKAITLAEHHKRFEHGTRARLLLGMLYYVSGDMAAMRKTLVPHQKVSILARILLANTESAGRAMPLLADGLREATEQGDVLAYMLCILIGARRYLVMGRDPDALVTLSAGIAQLRPVAPHLSGVLAEERATWQKDWGNVRFEAAEAQALKLLDEP